MSHEKSFTFINRIVTAGQVEFLIKILIDALKKIQIIETVQLQKPF